MDRARARDFVFAVGRLRMRRTCAGGPRRRTGVSARAAVAGITPRGFFTKRARLRLGHSFPRQYSKNALTVLMYFAAVCGLTFHDDRKSRTSAGPNWSRRTYPLVSAYPCSFLSSRPYFLRVVAAACSWNSAVNASMARASLTRDGSTGEEGKTGGATIGTPSQDWAASQAAATALAS